MTGEQNQDWCHVRERLGPAALSAIDALTAQAPQATPAQRAELAVILRRHPNPAATDAA